MGKLEFRRGLLADAVNLVGERAFAGLLLDGRAFVDEAKDPLHINYNSR